MTAAKKWLLSVSMMWVITSALAQGQEESTEQPLVAPDASSTEVAATSTEEEDYDDYMDYAEFVEHDMEDQTYEREFTFLIPKGAIKTEFYVEMDKGMRLDMNAQILTMQESNGRPIPLTVTLKDEGRRVVAMGQDRDGKIINIEHSIEETAVYEVVFHVMDYHTENKNLWVELTIEGKTDIREVDKKFKLKREKKYKEIHDNLIKTMKHVQKNQMTAFRHQLSKGHGTRRSQSRVEALAGMIDKWSMIHVFVVLVVMVAQVFVLKGFFELPTGSSKI